MTDFRPTRRAPEGRELVVDRPELQRGPQRFIYSTLTLIAWAVWVYLWLPLVTLVAWYFGLRVFLREIVIPDPRTMLMVGIAYLIVVVLLGGALLIWSRYNVRRFRGNERREEAPPLGDAEVREWFDIPIDVLERFRSADSMTVHLDQDGHVEDVVTAPPIRG